LADIKFKNTGIDSLDAFFGNCNNILADISGIIGKLFDFRINFIKNTGFDQVPGSTMKQSFNGFLLAAIASCGSIVDISGIIKFSEEAPYIEFDFSAIKVDVEYYKKIF